MYLKTLVLVLVMNILKVDTKKICVSDMQDTTTGISNSFNNLKKSISSFFTISFVKLEESRRKVKKALHRFIDEVFYNKPARSLKCSYDKHVDKEFDINAPDVIVHDGYQVETHRVLTPDGYILSVHRIVSSGYNTSSGDREIVILSHGLVGSSIDWVLLGPEKALSYILSDAGYDVWLPNFRGNIYSRSHATKKTNSRDYWNFSWHEIGLFDIPAVIDYVREITSEKSQIHFVTYCMSSSALLALLSTTQRYNAILKSVTLLAPLVYMEYVKGPLKYLAELYSQYRNNINTFMKIESKFECDELFDKSFFAQLYEDIEPFCDNPLLLLGDDGKQNASISLRINYNHMSSGGSTKTIVHYLQLIKSGNFQMFDLGESENFVKYRSVTPPLYHLFNVKTPIILISGINDSIATAQDLSKLPFHIPDLINHAIDVYNFSHLDFLLAESATKLVYLPLMEELKKI